MRTTRCGSQMEPRGALQEQRACKIEIKKISFEVEKERQEEVVKKIKELYPDLDVSQEGDTISVSGDLHNYKKHDKILWILSGGKHGKDI